MNFLVILDQVAFLKCFRILAGSPDFFQFCSVELARLLGRNESRYRTFSRLETHMLP